MLVTETPKSKEFITWLTTHTRDAERRKNDGVFDRFLNSPRYRASQVEHGWTEELCAKHDALAQEGRSYTHTAREHQRLASTWTVSSSQQFGQNGPMAERPGYAEAVRIRNRLCKMSQVKRMGEFIPVSKDDNEVTTHVWRQVKEAHVLIARRDGSGIRILSHGRLLNFGGHCPSGTNSSNISKKGCRMSLPGNSDSL